MARTEILLRWILFVCVIYLIGWVWRPVVVTLPESLTEVATLQALADLPPDTDFLLAGQVQPLPEAPDHTWQGRFAFLHRQLQDHSNSAGRSRAVVTVASHRPAMDLLAGGQALRIPTESYDLRYAPRVAPRFWPRKWLWTTRVDDWDKSSTGLLPGQEVLALGRIQADGPPAISALLRTPLTAVAREMDWHNRVRAWLTRGLKVVLSVVAVAFLLAPCWQGGRSQAPGASPADTPESV